MTARFRLALTLGAMAASLAHATDAHADDANVSSARTAYDEGAAAYDAADYPRACASFDRADALAPNVTVLKLALTSCLRSDDAVRSMNLVERARGRDTMRELAETATARFAGRLARIGFQCGSATPCSATLDGTPMAVGSAQWVPPGPHVLELTTARGPEKRALWLSAGEYQLVTPAKGPQESSGASPAPPPARVAPPPPALAVRPTPSPEDTPDTSAASSRGVSPAWFWVGVGATALLGGATIASGVDTLGKHNTFMGNPSGTTANDGLDAQRRTNVLLVGTGAAALITTVVGLFVVRWSSQPRESARR